MEYFLKASAITTIFYISYKLFLQRETFFESNRWFLLIGLLATICLPFLIIPIYIENPNSVINISTFTDSIDIASTKNTDYIFIFFSSIYVLGVSFFFLKLILELVSLFRLLKKTKSKTLDGFKIIKTEGITSPFSFFNFIAYNPKQFNENELMHIINHEKVHAHHLHSIDNLLIQFVIVIFWFNPFIWLYKKELQQNLEFIADKNAQRISSCKKSYEYVLLKTTISNQQLVLTNNFYTSLIKKRIIMLHKSKSNKLNALKYVFVLPLLVIFLMSFNTKEVYLNKNSFNVINTIGDLEIAIISKDFTDTELETVKDEFKKNGVDLHFKNIKRNARNEIISIKIEANSKKTKTSFSSNSSNAIKPVKITYNSQDNSISISTIEDQKVFITEDGTTKIIKSGSNSNVVILSEDEKDENHNVEVVITDENGNDKDTKVIVKRKKEIIHLDSDATESKQKVRFITKDKDGNVITEEIKEGKESKTWVVEEDETNDIKLIKAKTKNNKVFITTNKTNSPLILIDGKESTSLDLEILDPNNIATINVIKGDKQTKKYGKKAKDGVILVITKK